MKRIVSVLLLLMFVFVMGLSSEVKADNIYELRKLTEDDWLSMTAEDRLRALGAAKRHEMNQTFLGNFGRNYDLYKKWGYEFYEMEDRYENYAFRGYNAYNIIEERRRRWSYNEFGDRIAKMRHSANIWREHYSGDGTYYVEVPWNYINSSSEVSRHVNGVWVAREATDDWAISAIGAGSLRTKLTPLTLSIPNINGISLDFQSANNSIKLITSSYLGSYRGWTYLNPRSSYLVNQGGVMLRGGRFQRKLGMLTLGATYANMYGVQGNRERGSEWRGTVNNYTPTPMILAVRFLDDSPQDGEGGPIVYDIRLKLNGRYHDEFIPQVILDDVTRDRTTAITDKLDAIYLEFTSPISLGNTEFDFLTIEGRIPKYVDYIYLNDSMKGHNIENVYNKFSRNLANQYYTITEQAGKPIQANGTVSIVYLFDISSFTDKINRIEAVTTVANDYHIQTAMIYTNNPMGGNDTSGKTKGWYDATYWRTVAQSEGNIKDGSNVRTIKIDFGYHIASIMYGFDADFNYRGFKVKGEFVTNSNHYMFADGIAGDGPPSNIVHGQVPRTGHRWSQVDHAYYVTAEKDWEKYGFTGEIFKMGKFYRPYLDYYDVAASSDWMDLINARNGFVRVPLIEDNDDDDKFPDTMAIQRTVGYHLYSTEDQDGVFPGNDDDNDGLADNNRNNNGIPDYDEPFFMFDVDPDEFVFGNDYNNNTIPDFREDDMLLDTPYNLDRQGYHFFMRYTPQKSIDLVAGSFRTRGVGTSIKTNDDYFKFILNYDVFDVGKLYAEYRHERIQDNFRDPYVQVDIRGKASIVGKELYHYSDFKRDLYYDRLEYRNSSVNRLFLDSKIRAVPSITLENHVKLERNDQVEGDMYDRTYQPNDVLNTLAMVNKIVYTKRCNNFIFSSGMKFRFYKKARTESLQPLEHYSMRIPLVMLKYVVSPDTDISLGMQGISGIELQFNDFVQPTNDYSEKTYALQLQNRTSYFGYQIWASAGIKFDQLIYKDAYRKFEEYKSSTTFVKVYLGW